jgi:hypothetical protein
MENERTELVEITRAVEACNAVAVPDPVRVALVRDLGPVANRLAKYAAATSMTVTNEAEAEEASQICTAIAADIATVKNHEVLSKITSGLHDLHRRWTGLRDLFVAPMTRDRKTIKDKVIAWQEAEKRKAEEIQRKLQAEADAKAAREREKQEAEACRQRQIEEDARRKAEDARRAAAEADGKERARLEAAANAADRAANAAAVKAEARVEAAASVIAPTVTVAAPKSGLRTSKAWKVVSIKHDAFYRALATRPDLRGYIEIKTTAMERVKAANPSMEIPGIEFEQITR